MSGQLCANLIFSVLRNPPPPEQQEAPPPQAWLAPVKSCHFSLNLLTQTRLYYGFWDGRRVTEVPGGLPRVNPPCHRLGEKGAVVTLKMVVNAQPVAH